MDFVIYLVWKWSEFVCSHISHRILYYVSWLHLRMKSFIPWVTIMFLFQYSLHFRVFSNMTLFIILSLQDVFPANTNILYVDLHSAELIGSSNNQTSLPGLVLNTKKEITYVDQFGIQHRYVPRTFDRCLLIFAWSLLRNSTLSRCIWLLVIARTLGHYAKKKRSPLGRIR